MDARRVSSPKPINKTAPPNLMTPDIFQSFDTLNNATHAKITNVSVAMNNPVVFNWVSSLP